MRFGAHVAASGGLWHAPHNGAALGGEVIQFFTRSPQMWNAKPIAPEDAEKFRSAMKECANGDAYIHAPYLINLASSNNRTRHGSISMLREELERGSQLGCRAMMFHPGSAKDVGEEKGVAMVIEGLDRILDAYEGTCQLLVEISAGAGAIMGDTFEEIAAFLDGAERGKEIGVCFDTQHAFASGYDLRTKEGLEDVVQQFDRTIGLKKLIASHCNDSKVPFDSHKDRHEHLGHGHIGIAAFEHLVQHPKLQHLDLILETPFDDEGGPDDGTRAEDLAYLKRFRESI